MAIYYKLENMYFMTSKFVICFQVRLADDKIINEKKCVYMYKIDLKQKQVFL